MNLDFQLTLTQEQKLVMTLQMQQSIKLLQMSSYELLQHIDKELQENVVLEIEGFKEDTISNNDRNEFKDYKDLIKYLEFDNYGSNFYYQDEDKESISPFNFISNKLTIKDYLKEQLIESNVKGNEYLICEYIIESIDNKGYLHENIIEDLSKELNIHENIGEKCLYIIQSLDPSGIGARNISECLLIQLKKKGIHDEVLEAIIQNYLELLSRGKYNTIAKELNIQPKEVQKYEDIIKTLEPKPTRGFFTGEDVSYVIPDAYIKKIDDEYVVLMNDTLIPRLGINNVYKSVINNDNDNTAVNYVKEKINSAMFLIKSIESRKNTLFRVIEEIIKVQIDYLNLGEQYLKPMTIKDIANSLEMHESTVSRAIRDKYVALHTGEIKRIKDIFTTHLNTTNEDISVVNVKTMIKDIILNEDKNKPLSDANICKVLNDKSIDISRRTVAKYREEMNIKSSAQRKRL